MSQYDPIGPEKESAFQEPQFAPEPPARKGPGCLFWGCLITGILFLVIVALIIASAVLGRNWLINKARDLSEPNPAELPEIQLTDEERQQVLDRWAEFEQALEEGRADEIALDSDAFNVIVQQEEPDAKGRAYFSIEGDELKGQVSLPVDAFGEMLMTDRLAGRYFNASGTFNLFLRDGLLFLQLQEAEVKGEPVPEQIMNELRGQNLAENMAKDPEQRAFFSKFERIEIKDGKIILTSRGTGEAAVEGEGEGKGEGEGEGESEAEPAAEGEAVEPPAEAEGEAEPVAEPTEEPAAEEPAPEPAAEEPAAEEPAAEEPAPEPAAEEPAAA
ncbi:hypothetical protein [Tautonia sociabilis]|uniref:hypothetical protein n=1 Tax=Tautonia sociabilis TaxID=2080755 RepID=UPI0013158EBA|nr:hypothetical protein [Tautonia sociabilis]